MLTRTSLLRAAVAATVGAALVIVGPTATASAAQAPASGRTS